MTTPPPGILTLVSTPIGNLGDMTYRAVEELKAANLILVEDTRRSRTLLDHYGITARPQAYHDHNKERVTPGLVERLLAGDRIALITDAGTPGVSDPGFYLVRAAVAAGVRVSAAPGASAILPALVLSGLPTDAFAFEGFPPKKKGQLATTMAALAEERRTTVFYVAPHQLIKVLEVLAATLPERQIAVARELTKLHEEMVRGTPGDVLSRFEGRTVRGEVVVVVAGAGRKPPRRAARDEGKGA